MIELVQHNIQKKVVKRDGKKVEFDGKKIALAIQKGFDSIQRENKEENKYNEDDVNKIYNLVILEIERNQNDRVKIEEIQDMIEEKLQQEGYEDVYEAFSDYRERRNQSRKIFFDEKKQHKFLKALENLGLKSMNEEDNKCESTNINNNTAMGNMLQYGSTISKEFAKSYLIKKKFVEAHENGDIYIHNMNFLPMGTTACCNIELKKLFEDGFSTGYAYIREPNDIMSYSALANIAIQSNQNDQHLGQTIPAFDYDMAPGIVKTFKKQFKQIVYGYLELTDFDKFIAINGIEREIEKIDTIKFDIDIFYKYCRESEELKRMFRISYKKALQKTNYNTYQAMEALIHNLNIIHLREGSKVKFSCINFGTDTSPEGRMIIENILKAIGSGIGNHKTPIFPISVFKVKEGINYNPGEPNYDLFQLACKISAKNSFPNFCFIDAPFNKDFYKSENYNTQVAYMGNSIRILDNMVDSSRAFTGGRGNLSFTTINLPRLGIKHGKIADKKTDLEAFFIELEEKLELVKDQLMERFEIQCNKRIDNFPFLLGQGIWIESERLKSEDKLRKVLKHGTLSIGFVGLAECLKALTGKNHVESKESQELGIKIVKFMRKKCDEYSEKYNLNFTLISTPMEELTGRFNRIDKAIYGKLDGITDRECYTNSFHIPSYYKIKPEQKIILEAPYHEYTNGGHITYIQLEKEDKDNLEEFERLIRIMKENGIGYGAIK